jgi:heptosyltransferase I
VSDAARKIPAAEIDWVVEAPFAGIAAMHPAVRRVIPVRLREWRRRWWRGGTWRELSQFRRTLRTERYDAIVDTQSLLKSALVASWALGPRHGMDRASAREPLAARFYHRAHAVPRGLHAVERNRRLTAEALGLSLQHPLDYGLRAGAASAVQLPEEYSVLLTMTSRADKLWPEARWIALGRALGIATVLPWGSPDERARAERIASAIPHSVIPERMSVEALAAVLGRARNVAGLDSGLTHLAAALGAPTVAIFCGSDPALTGVYGAARAWNVGQAGRAPEVAEVLRKLG